MTAKKNVGYALHYNLEADKKTPLKDEKKAPNPEIWELVHKKGKGFVLVQDGEEIERDMEGV